MEIKTEMNTQQPVQPIVADNNSPMRLGQWIVMWLLFCIPIANIVLMIVWAAGKNVNRSKKTLCQSMLIMYGACAVMYLLVFIMIMGAR